MAAATGTAIAMALAAAAASAYNTNRTLNKQDNQAAEGIRRQQRIQREADARVASELAKVKGSNPQDEAAANQAMMLEQIAGAQAKARRGLQMTGATSADYRDAAGAASAGATDYASQIASLLAQTDAAQQQRQQEGFDRADLATDIGVIARRSRGDQFVNDLKVRGIRRNPWIDMAAQAASGYASGGMTGGGGG